MAGLKQAAVGNQAVLARSIEKGNIGLPQSLWKFINFISVDMARANEHNASTSITGSGGMDRGTLGGIKHTDKLKYDATTNRLAMDLVAMFGLGESSVEALNQTIPIDSLSQVDKKFILAGPTDWSVYFKPGDSITVTGSTGNDGTYTVVSATFTTSTEIVVTEAIPDSTVDGSIVTAARAWLLKIRPDRDNDVRSLSFYLDEGGSYAPSVQFGRRCQDITLSENANKRIEADVTYAEPTGDTISGAFIAKSTNSGTHDVKIVGARGRRAFDADYSAGKSVYIKVVSRTADAAVLLAKVDTASGMTDGTGFGAGTYGATTFTVSRPTDNTDGWTPVIDSNTGLVLGLFGENNEPFEITLGDVDLTDLAADDQFEIPIAIRRLTKTGQAENRLSAFHLLRTLGTSTDVRIDSGSMKISRPFKPYMTNGRRLPQTVDPTGKIAMTTNFKKRLFDTFFRRTEDVDSRFTLFDVFKFGTPIPYTGGVFEKVEIFQPQCMISALKSGDVAGFDTLDETVTLEAEQPDDSSDGSLTANGITPPDDFDDTTEYAYQINITLPIDVTYLE